MLLAIREKVQGWIAWAIVIVLIVPFALWGIDQYARGDKTVVVADVNGEAISGNTFLQMYNRQRMRLMQQFGEMYDQVVEDEELRKQVLEALIDSQLIKQWAFEQGMLISDQQLASIIQAAEVFQDKGVFSEQVYQDILLRNGLTVSSFEFEQRQFLIESQFRALTSSTEFVTASELERLYQLQNQRRQIDYIRIDQRVFRQDINVSEQQMQDYFQANAAQFVIPEKVQVDYVSLSQEAIAKEITLSDEQVKEYFATNQALFTQAEMRRARHILIRGDEAAAREKMTEVQNKLAAGESFEELAKAYSEDPGSALSGGDLDFFEQGMMVPEFDQAVFAMEKGQVSDVIKTDFGLHLIQLTDIRPQMTPNFADVEQDVKQQLAEELAEKLYYERLEALTTLAYEQPDSLEPLVGLANGAIQTSEGLTREGLPNGVLSLPRVIEVAFSEEVLKSRLNSSPIEVGPNASIVLRVRDYQPQHQQSFEEVQAQVKEALIREGTIQKAADLADKVLAEILAGKDPEDMVSSGVEWHAVGWIERQNQQVLPQITQVAFKAKKPGEQPSWEKVQLFTGDTVLVRVSAIDVVESEERRSQVSHLEAALRDVYANAELQSRMAELKQNAKIERHSNYLILK